MRVEREEHRAGRCVILRGAARSGTEQLAVALGARIVTLRSAADLDRAVQESERSTVVWTHPWTRATPELCQALCRTLGDFAAGGGVRVALARRSLVWRDGSISLGRALVASAPGSILLRGDRPLARRDAVIAELGLDWQLDAPASLDAQLAEINADTSIAADLAAAAGDVPTWRGLLWSPLGFALRALASAHGRRRTGLPRIALEAYRQTLFTAKLWERRTVSAATLSPAAGS